MKKILVYLAKLDGRDLMVITGLGLLTAGVWMINMAFALIISGVILLGFGIYASIPGRK